jgi:hypothetical protein
MPQQNDETAIQKTNGCLASYQWLLYIHHHVMITFKKYIPDTTKRVHAISCVVTFWQEKKNSCHKLWSKGKGFPLQA